MKRLLLLALMILGFAIPATAQYRMPVNTAMTADGKMIYTDYSAKELSKPADPQIQITQEVVVDYLCVTAPGNPPPGLIRLYCESTTGQLTCLTSAGAGCLAGGGGGGGGGGSVASVGLLGPTGIPITNSPVTSTGVLTWSMPAGWVLGDLLIGNGSNSVARLAAPTTPDATPQTLISTPSSGATAPAWALAGLAGRVVSGTSDTILATDRSPKTIEYTSNSPTAITVPEPASAGFTSSPSFVTIAEGAGPYTFTPAATAVITYCTGALCFSGQPNLVLQQGQYATWSSPSTSNWLVRISGTGPGTTSLCTGNQLLSGGGVVWTGLLNFTVSSANYCIAGTTYTSAQTNLTLAAADPSNPRIDVIAVDNTGTAVVITGTPAANPAAPSVEPTSQLALTFVTVPAGSTTPTITSTTIYDESSTPPTEWTCSSTAAFNCASTNNPFHLTHDIEVTNAVPNGNVVLTNNTTVNLSTYNTLSFYIRNKAVWATSISVSICFLNGTAVVGNCIGFKNGVFGFDQSNITGYQQIVIPVANFGTGSNVVNKLRFQIAGASGSQVGFYLDWIQIQSALSGSPGSNVPPPSVNVLGTDVNTAFIAANRTAVDAISYAAGGGSANAQTVSLTPVIIGLTTGLKVCWKPSNANASTTPTLAVNGLTAKTIVKVGGAALAASDLTTTAIACAIYDGTNFELQNPQTSPTSAVTTTGSPAIGNLTKFSGASSITNGDLSGDCTTSGTLAVTCTKINGGTVPTSAGLLGTNGSAQLVTATFPEVKIIPAANCPNAVAGSGWSYATSTYTAACRAGSNNLGGALQLAPSTGGAAQFRMELPADWNTSSQPYIRIEYGSGANTSGTVIWTVASACTKADGSVTDDPSFNAESAFGTQTMAAASRAWSQTGQFTAITSGNNCIGGSGLIIKLTLSGTASSAINAYQAVVTVPRSIVVQAN